MTFEIHKLHHAIVHLSSQNVKYIYIQILIVFINLRSYDF